MSRSRRAERRAAAFLLYQRDLTGADPDALYAGYERDNGEPVTDFIRGHVEGAWDDAAGPRRRDRRGRRGLDRRPDGGPGAKRPPPGRLGATRAARFRRRWPSTRRLRIAKRYASPEAAALVNGVLGRIAREEGVGR